MVSAKSQFYGLAAATIVVATFALSLTGCGKPIPPPQPIDAGRAAIGIEVSIRKPIHIGSDDAQIVYFARLEEGEGLESLDKCENILASNYSAGDQLLLLNARPGTYAVVAATFTRQEPTAGMAAPSSTPGTAPAPPKLLQYRVFFSKDLITRTCFNIVPNTFTYIGKVKVSSSLGMSDADPAQKHYQQIIEGPSANTSGLARMLDPEFSYRGSLLEFIDDDATEQAFVDKVTPRLQNTGWAPMLARRHRERAQ